MADINGTNNGDFIVFQGDLQNLTLTLVNPYSGELLEIDADFLLSTQSYDGLAGFDYLLMGNTGDALFLDGSSFSSSGDTNDRSPNIANIEYIIAGSGGDVINLASYINNYDDIRIDGGQGGDILWTNQGDDIVSGHDGNDHIVTGAGDDHIQGLNDDDYLNGGTGADLLDGGNGNDRLKYTADGVWENTSLTDLTDITGKNASYDTFRGGDGYDQLQLTHGDDVLLMTDNISARQRSANGDRIADIEEIRAGAGDDVIDLMNDNIYQTDIKLYGEDGQDFMRSGRGNDQLFGGSGDDVIYGGDGNDILYGGDNSGELRYEEHLFSDAVAFPTLRERKNYKRIEDPENTALGVAEGDLSVAYKTTATFTFMESKAGYRNSLGFYRINHEDGTIEGVEVGFANVKAYKAGTAYTADLPGAPDTDFGFFIISNGFSKNRGYNGLDIEGTEHLKFVYDYGGANERLATIYDNGHDVSLVYDDGSTTKLLRGDVYHTTARGGDTDINRDSADHVVSGLVDANDQSVLRIGFEDLKNLGDADYNDVVFDLEIEGQLIDTSDQGNDVLIGGAGNDLLYGEGGHDVLIMGDGADTAFGGTGHDIFKFDVMDSLVDMISDFNSHGDKDVLDISSLLENYDPLTDAIEDFIQFTTQENGDVIVQVHDGTEFVDLVEIQGGVSDQSIQDMVDNGQLIIE